MKQVIYTYDDLKWSEYVQLMNAYKKGDAIEVLSVLCREDAANCSLYELPTIDDSRFVRQRRAALDEWNGQKIELDMGKYSALAVIAFQEEMKNVGDLYMPVNCLSKLFNVDVTDCPVSAILDWFDYFSDCWAVLKKEMVKRLKKLLKKNDSVEIKDLITRLEDGLR